MEASSDWPDADFAVIMDEYHLRKYSMASELRRASIVARMKDEVKVQ
jgi:hypothetical protein